MKWNKLKKAISLLSAAALLLGAFHPTEQIRAAEDLLEGTDLLVHYEFLDGGTDSSGNGNDAVIGEGVTVENGIASLPGGDANSSAYITLPEGMFDKQDTLTISMWLRDNDPRTSWLGAFFFGSPKNSNGVPAHYYYFVPCEKDHNTLKSVFTEGTNESSPNQTEKGIRESVNTAAYQGVWTHYAIVLTPGTMICYIDGTKAGEASYNSKVSDFGTGLQSYIGKSNYPDPIYQGDFRDFRVYKNALTQQQIQQLVGTGEESLQYSMTIDGANVTKQLSENLYGLFYEDINSAADGGLYPEMVKNYSFENAYVQAGNNNSDYFKKNGYETVGHYKLHWTPSDASKFAVEDTSGLNENNPHYAALTGNVTLENGGFAPQNSPNSAAMPVKPVNEEKKTGTYTFSVFAKAAAGYNGTIKVKLTDDSGRALTDEQQLTILADGNWNRISADLTANVSKNTKGKLVLTVEGAAASDKLYLDMISVVPHDSFGYGNPNYACGVGIRQDLIDLMMDLNPKFMRFPGGCIVEGFNWEGLYNWKDTIGPLEERKANTNRWENWNNKNRTWGYMQSFGFGYHEILSLCEEFGMEPFPIISAGVLCQYETKDVEAKTGDELNYFIQMATDLLDYCWGDPSKNEWAAKREANGHPEPFNMNYLGIGNENAFAKYFDNFDVIKKAVEEYVEKYYPDHELHIISSAGPTSNSNPAGDGYFSRSLEYAYDRLAQTMPGETLVDEHYYESESFMYNQSDRYDYYQRTDQGGSNVFVGEYAVKNDNKFNTALAEACYMTGLERNADVVTNISYAPLLYKQGSLSWTHDLIYFDEFDTAKSTNYYVQKMYANNYGSKLIDTRLQSPETDYSNYGSPILGTSSAAGSIDKITIYDSNGAVLLEDEFNDNANGWETFGSKGSGNSFTITGGKLVFSGTTGLNAVYLPRAIAEKWENFKIVTEGVTKTSGSGSMLIGAGHDKQYYWYNMGKDGAETCMEVTRPERHKSNLTTKTLGNNYANKHYNTVGLTKIQTNDPMQVTFNFGTEGKLEAGYTSASVSSTDTAKYNFSSTLNQYQTDIYQVVTMDDKNVYMKLVNPDKNKKDIQLNFKNLNLAADSSAEITMLTGGLDIANAIGNEQIAPVSSTQNVEENALLYQLPAFSVNVIRIPLSVKEEEPKTDKSKLNAAIQTASAKVQKEYTAESWKKLQTALAAAEQVNQNAAATQTQIDAAVTELNTAIAGLILIGNTQDKNDTQNTEKEPETPASVKASWTGTKNIKISWKKGTNAAQYEVYRSTKKTSGFKKIATVTAASYTDKKAAAGKTIYYKVVALNGTKRSAESKTVSAYIVKTPASIKAKVSKRTVTVSFKKAAKASGYEIYRATKKNGKYKKAAELKSAKKVKKTFKNMKKGKYFFKVRAYKKVSGKKIYTSYSKTVKATVK